MKCPCCGAAELVRGTRDLPLTYKQLCSMSSVLCRLNVPSCIPQRLIPEHGVEDRQQLAHAGDDGHLLGLARGDQTVVESLDHRVESGRAQRGHVDHGAHIAASAPDAALAVARARIVGQWRNAHELGHLATAELAQLRQRRGQRHDGDRAHAFDAIEQGPLRLEAPLQAP